MSYILAKVAKIGCLPAPTEGEYTVKIVPHIWHIIWENTTSALLMLSAGRNYCSRHPAALILIVMLLLSIN